MASGDTGSIVSRLARHGFNADSAAITRLAAAEDPEAAVAATIEAVPADTIRITTDHLPPAVTERTPSVSTGTDTDQATSVGDSPPETEGSPPIVSGDVTGRSTGTGEYGDFVAVFRDRYERLASELRGRVTHRAARSLENARGGGEVGFIGLINEIRTTKNGHWLVELEDTTGVFPVLILADSDASDAVEELVPDEVIGVTGRLADDGEILFVESLHFPDIPRTYTPNTADRHVQAALLSDLHVGSKEFLEDAWADFTAWLQTEEADAIEYLVIAGDMVEGVGVYPGQDADLTVIDIYEQYERFGAAMADVPSDIELIMIPGNHDAVRLAEPQPALDDAFLDPLTDHEVTISSNPSTVTIESVRILLYHGAALDELIAQYPGTEFSYESPHRVMASQLRKRHLAPPFGGLVRIAPEERDYLVIEEPPDVLHSGHVHTVGVGEYNGVRIVNSGCWQAQTDFQRRNNLVPDPGIAPILDLDTLDVTLRKFT